MSTKYIISTIAVAALLSLAVCIYAHGKKHEASRLAQQWTEDIFESDEESAVDSLGPAYDYVPIEIPAAIRNLAPEGQWDADTLCAVGEKVYYHAYVEDMPKSLIYCGDKVLVETTDLAWYPDTTNSHRFTIKSGPRTLKVDFSDAKSVARLSTLAPRHTGYDRYWKHQFADFGRRVLYCLEVDYPQPSVPHSQEITKWLTDFMISSNSPMEEVVNDSKHIYYENDYASASQYKGGTGNKDALFGYLSQQYFDSVKKDFGTNLEDFPYELYSNMSLRVHVSKERFVTYQVYTNDYSGGAHGFFSISLVSYDPVHQQEIGWGELFKPQSFEAVLKLIEAEAQKDEQYIYWNAHIQKGLDFVDEDGNPTGELLLPGLGLGEDGVIFSFQPYSIACFAAGTFHFTIPYKTLKPHLTPRAHWLLQQ